MARLYTDFPFSGTFGNLTVYRVRGKCYARTKSSLDQKRLQKDPAFACSRERAALFGQAARLASFVYRELPKAVKRHGLMGTLTSLAFKGLQAGKNWDIIARELRAYCGIEEAAESVVTPAIVAAKPVVKRPGVIATQGHSLSAWSINHKGVLERGRIKPLTIALTLSFPSTTLIAVPSDG